jgi:hypothetical protein
VITTLSVYLCILPYQLLNGWTNLYKTWYIYHGIWANLNGVLHHKSLQLVCEFAYVSPSRCLATARKHVPAATNTQGKIEELLDASYQWKVGDYFFPELLVKMTGLVGDRPYFSWRMISYPLLVTAWWVPSQLSNISGSYLLHPTAKVRQEVTENRDNYIIMSFIICTLNKIRVLLVWSNQWGSNGQVTHTRESRKIVLIEKRKGIRTHRM